MSESKTEILNQDANNGILEKLFKIKAHGSSVKNELVGVSRPSPPWHTLSSLTHKLWPHQVWTRGRIRRNLYWCCDRLFANGVICELACRPCAGYGPECLLLVHCSK